MVVTASERGAKLQINEKGGSKSRSETMRGPEASGRAFFGVADLSYRLCLKRDNAEIAVPAIAFGRGPLGSRALARSITHRFGNKRILPNAIFGTIVLSCLRLVPWCSSAFAGSKSGWRAEDLKDLGVSMVGHRRNLLDAIAALRADREPKTALATPEIRPQPTFATCRKAAGERRHLTVIFCDRVDSTGIAARLHAEVWRDLANAYLDDASAAVMVMGGHVAKKLGDGLMALFGYPLAHENDAD
jgi:hypothetical protein